MNEPRDDSELLAALADGDLDALGGLYDAYAERVYHVLLARGLQRDAAEDVLQDVFLSLVDRGRGAARIRNVLAYLLTVARNMAARHLRRAQRRARLELVEPATGSAIAAAVTAELTAREALSQLPPEQTEVVTLKVWGEMTFAEIGDALDISPNTAASRYRYALEKLRDVWEDTPDEA